MQVTVVCFGAMRDHLPPTADGNRALVNVPERATVSEVIGALGAPPGLVHMILVDEAPSRPDRVLGSGQEVTLMPRYSGG